MSDVSRFRECKKLLLYAPANHSARFHFLVESLNRRVENDPGNAERQMWNCNETALGGRYDKVSKAINFRALAQKIQLKNLESKVTISVFRRDMASFDSTILS